MARPKKVEQGNDAAVAVASELAGDVETEQPAAEVLPLHDYIAANEGKKLADGLVLVKVTHPQADTRIFPGRYSGINVEQGPAACLWSDGSTA